MLERGRTHLVGAGGLGASVATRGAERECTSERRKKTHRKV
jgi:hypothetical protein